MDNLKEKLIAGELVCYEPAIDSSTRHDLRPLLNAVALLLAERGYQEITIQLRELKNTLYVHRHLIDGIVTNG